MSTATQGKGGMECPSVRNISRVNSLHGSTPTLKTSVYEPSVDVSTRKWSLLLETRRLKSPEERPTRSFRPQGGLPPTIQVVH